MLILNVVIGIEYGKLRVIKVGIQRSGSKNGENKGLVWVGHSANYTFPLYTLE